MHEGQKDECDFESMLSKERQSIQTFEEKFKKKTCKCPEWNIVKACKSVDLPTRLHVFMFRWCSATNTIDSCHSDILEDNPSDAIDHSPSIPWRKE